MREIKFRAWYEVGVLNDKWYEWTKSGKRGWELFEEETGEKFVVSRENRMHHDVCISNEGRVMMLESGWDYQGDNEDAVVMQYTGLKDKNGVEIYEGDVIESIENGYIYVIQDLLPVSRHTESDCIGLREKDGNILKSNGIREHSSDDWMSWNEMYEVIGNIYENPELIKE